MKSTLACLTQYGLAAGALIGAAWLADPAMTDPLPVIAWTLGMLIAVRVLAPRALKLWDNRRRPKIPEHRAMLMAVVLLVAAPAFAFLAHLSPDDPIWPWRMIGAGALAVLALRWALRPLWSVLRRDWTVIALRRRADLMDEWYRAERLRAEDRERISNKHLSRANALQVDNEELREKNRALNEAILATRKEAERLRRQLAAARGRITKIERAKQ